MSKKFYTNTLLFFVLLGTASPLKTFYMSLNSTKRKTSKSYLKLLRFFWMLMDMSLRELDIYQGTGATNCFKSHISSSCSHFFKKKFWLIFGLKFTLADVKSFLPNNLSGLKKSYIRAWGNRTSLAEINKCRWCLLVKYF